MTRPSRHNNTRRIVQEMMNRRLAFTARVVILTLSVCVTFRAAAQQRHEFTIAEAVELAYKNVIDVKNKELDLKIQEAMNKEILGQALPQLSGAAGAQYYFKLPQFLFPDATSTAVYQILKDEGVQGSSGPITNVPQPALIPVSLQQPWNANFGLTLTQLLFQPDVFVGLQARATSIEFARKNIELAREDVKDSAYKRYYAVLIAQKQLEFLNDGVKRIEKLVRDNEAMYQQGFVEKLDVERAQVQLSNLRTAQTSLKNAIYISYAALKFALGIPQADTVVLKDSLSVESVKEGILDNDFRYEDRKEYQLLQTGLELQKLDLKRYKLGYIPTISLSGNYARQGMSDKFIFSKGDNDFWYNTGFVGLNVNVPIFDGLQRRYKVKQSELKLEQVQNNLTNLERAIDFQQSVSLQSLKDALLNLDEQQKNMALAEKVYNTTKRKFEEGVGSSFDIIQAENDLQTSQSNYFQALYTATVARLNYFRAIGKL